MNEAILVQDVRKSFGKKVVLEHINLEIQSGRIYGLIGPSGSGKTTLIKMIVGMDVPDKGSIHLLDKKMPNLNILQEIGYMAQSDGTLYRTYWKRKSYVFCIII